MRQVARDAVLGVQRGDDLRGRQLGQVIEGPELRALRVDAVDAAFVGAGADIKRLEPVGRNPARVLDDKAIHVHHPQRAVGTGERLDGAKPVVGAREKLGRDLISSTRGGEGDAARREHEAADQVMHRLADEEVLAEARAQQRVAIHAEPAGARDVVQGLRTVETLQRLADGIQAREAGGEVHARRRRGDVRVAREVAVWQRVVERELAVVAPEPIPQVVARPPLLRQAGGGLELAGVGPETEIAPADVEWLRIEG